jgi:hypothetical protein
MQSARYSCRVLMRLQCSGHIYEKYLNIEFHENTSSASRVVPCGRTDLTKLIVSFLGVLRTRLRRNVVWRVFGKIEMTHIIRTRAACITALLVTPQVCGRQSMREASVHICEHLPCTTVDYYVPRTVTFQ